MSRELTPCCDRVEEGARMCPHGCGAMLCDEHHDAHLERCRLLTAPPVPKAKPQRVAEKLPEQHGKGVTADVAGRSLIRVDVAGGLNKVERRYAAHLAQDPGVAWFRAHPFRFEIGRDARGRAITWAPDFLVARPVGEGLQLEVIDTKGAERGVAASVQREQRVKLRACSGMFPFARYGTARFKGGAWSVEFLETRRTEDE